MQESNHYYLTEFNFPYFCTVFDLTDHSVRKERVRGKICCETFLPLNHEQQRKRTQRELKSGKRSNFPIKELQNYSVFCKKGKELLEKRHLLNRIKLHNMPRSRSRRLLVLDIEKGGYP